MTGDGRVRKDGVEQAQDERRPPRADAPAPPVAQLLALQRSAGNTAASRLLRVPTGTRHKRRGGVKPTREHLWIRILRERHGHPPDVARALAGASGSGRVIDEVDRLYRERRGGMTAADVVRVAALPGTADALLDLLEHATVPSLQEVDDLARAGRVAANLDELMAPQPFALSRADAFGLLRIRGRDMGAIRILAAAVPANTVATLGALAGHASGPTPQQIVAIGAAGHDAATLTNLTSPPYALTGADAIVLATIPGRSLADLQALATAVPALPVGRSVANLARLGRVARLSAAEAVTLANSARSMTDLFGLIDHGAAPSGAQLIKLAGAGRVAADLDTLIGPPSSVSPADAIRLASIPGRDMAYLQTLAAAVPALPGPRTTDELAKLAELQAPRLAAGDAVDVANVPNRTLTDLTGLLTHALNLTPAQVVAIGKAGRTGAELTALTQPPYSLAAADAIELASVQGRNLAGINQLAAAVAALPGGRTAADLAALAGRGSPAHVVGIADAIALAGIPLRPRADLETIADAIPALIAGRLIAGVVALANHGAPAHRLAADHVAALVGAGGVPSTVPTAQLLLMIDELPGLDGVQIRDVIAWLHPSLSHALTLALLVKLHAGPLTGAEIHALLQRCSAAGLTGQQIRTRLDQYWTTYGVADPDPITRPSAPGPPPVAAGTRVLDATMLQQHIIANLAGGPASVAGLTANLKKYPTGQDPAALTEDQLWLDCAPANVPARIGPGAPETGQEALIRQRLALRELMTAPRLGLHGGTVQQIFAHNQGQAPRAILTPGQEDTLGAAHGAHNVDRHVLGAGGSINTLEHLVMRALGHAAVPGHTPAGAFANAGAMTAGVQAAINRWIAAAPANWSTLRWNFARRRTLNWTETGINPLGRRVDSNYGHPLNLSDLPPYTNPGGFGTWPLHAGDNYIARAQWRRHPPPAPGYAGGPLYLVGHNGAFVRVGGNRVRRTGFVPDPPLTTITANPPDVELRLIGDDVNGGFFVHAAWPC